MSERDDAPGGAADQPPSGDSTRSGPEPSPPGADAAPPTEPGWTATGATAPLPVETPPAAPAPSAPPPAPASPPGPVPPIAWGAPANPGPVAQEPTPMVAWPAAADTRPQATVGAYLGGVPPFTIGALLQDTFARYGADPIRLYAIAAVVGLIGFASTFASLGSNPLLGASRSFVDVSGILGLLSFVASYVAGSTTFALLEGGRRTSFGRVIRRGVERTGWFFLTGLLFLLGIFVIVLVAFIPGIVLALANDVLFVLYMVIVLLAVAWLAIRLSLALPANVVDNLNSIEAIKLSWAITRPTGVWARLLGVGLLIGLVVVPASIGGSLLLFPAVFGNQPALLVVAALALAFITPFGSIPIYSAYRRLVPPIPPSWTEPPPLAASPGMIDTAVPAAWAPMVDAAPTPVVEPAPAAPPPPDPAAPPPLAPLVAWADPSAPPPAPAPPAWGASQPAGPPLVSGSIAAPAQARRPFSVPAFGAGARAVLGILLAISVAGVLAVPWVIGEFVAGRIDVPAFPGFPGADPSDPGFPTFPGFPGLEGTVAEGTVAFGTTSDLGTCTLENQTTTIASAQSIFWMGSFTRRVTSADVVELRVLLDGVEILRDTEDAGTYDCLGPGVPDSGLTPGAYTFELILNGSVDATGTLFVTP